MQIFSMPKSIALDNTISPRARILYGHISALSYKRGYCWASNATLASTMGVCERQIKRDIAELARKQLLEIDLDKSVPRGTKRKITCVKGRDTQVPSKKLDGTIQSKTTGQPCPTSSSRLVIQGGKDSPPQIKRKLTKTELVTQARNLSRNWREAKKSASPEVTESVRAVIGSWQQAGALPVREWQFIQHELHTHYMEQIS